ncbi:MAG: ribonuclease III [Synergistaceae bacterium]|jgi:ribonuclease-3|nr:ribonuclease III [Synergistaceae bacterium]
MSHDGGDFEREIGYAFKCRPLFEEALTHASYANENGMPRSNERLEFLGDAVLELCVSEKLFSSCPEGNEGVLTTARSLIVREAALAFRAASTSLPGLLRLSRGLELQGGRSNPSILADAMEAVFGAVFVDGGYEAARDVVWRFIGDAEAEVASVVGRTGRHDKDAKSLLQEMLQALGDKPPVYRLIGRAGPDHAASFEVEASRADGYVLAVGRGNSIKTAEFAAAASALEYLESASRRDKSRARRKSANK